MNLFGLMETSGRAMQAERMRAEVVAANMANAETTRTAQGGPYRRQEVVFAANRGDAGFLNSMNDTMTGSMTESMNATAADAGTGSTRAGLISAGTAAPELPPLLPLRGASNRRRGVHIAQVVEDPSPPLNATIPAIPMPGRTGMSRIPTLILSQRWWT